MKFLAKSLALMALIAMAGVAHAGTLVVVKNPAAPASAAISAPVTRMTMPAMSASAPTGKAEAIVPMLPKEWRVTELDGTIRNTLKKWADLNNWIFRPEHWVVPHDFPVQGAMKFDGEFKSAVRQLLASTDLTDHPVQPCFYSNNVLRVVDRAELCDRMKGVNGFNAQLQTQPQPQPSMVMSAPMDPARILELKNKTPQN